MNTELRHCWQSCSDAADDIAEHYSPAWSPLACTPTRAVLMWKHAAASVFRFTTFLWCLEAAATVGKPSPSRARSIARNPSIAEAASIVAGCRLIVRRAATSSSGLHLLQPVVTSSCRAQRTAESACAHRHLTSRPSESSERFRREYGGAKCHPLFNNGAQFRQRRQRPPTATTRNDRRRRRPHS